jgi:hypothetical protein
MNSEFGIILKETVVDQSITPWRFSVGTERTHAWLQDVCYSLGSKLSPPELVSHAVGRDWICSVCTAV